MTHYLTLADAEAARPQGWHVVGPIHGAYTLAPGAQRPIRVPSVPVRMGSPVVSPLCFGSEDARGNPTCDGPDVRWVEVRPPGPSPLLFATHWCAECRAIAEADGYRITRLGPARP